jgi:alkaline phosphatase D
VKSDPFDRRRFAVQLASLTTMAYVGTTSRRLFSSEVSQDPGRPNITSGVASGDVNQSAATLWSRSDRESRMIVELATNESFDNARRVVGPYALENNDYCAKLRLTGLKPGEPVFYRIRFQDLTDLTKASEPVTGRFVTAAREPRNIKFTWSGDTAGQGYGINETVGGMKTFETMRTHQPDFFVNSGDVCYADNPIASELRLDDGTLWKNVISEGTSKVAETLEEFRSRYRYNLMDHNVRRLNAEVPCFVQWDDHEVLNNWYPTEILDDARYKVKSVGLLAARARQAFLDYLPIRATADGHSQIFRSIPYGPLLDLFFVDMRSYRAANSPNRQTTAGPETEFLGREQIHWLKKQLKASKAVWKVICSDMPIGLLVRDGRSDFENAANGDGPALGRELEVAELLRFIKRNKIRNTLWLTADVHYAASHYYDPEHAVFKDFDPFWEFVSGPLNAGTFGPGEFDNTFGPQLKFKGIPDKMKGNRPPSEGFQFFGLVTIDSQTRALSVAHYNAANERLWSVELPPKLD